MVKKCNLKHTQENSQKNWLIPPERILSSLPGAFIWKDKNLLYQAANLNIATNFGFKSIEEMVGLTSYDIRCAAVEYAHQFLKNDREVIRDGKNLQTIDVHEFSDNKIKMFFGERTPLLDKSGKISGVLYQAIEVYPKTLLELTTQLGKLNEKIHPENNLGKGYRFLIKESVDEFSVRELEVLFYLLRGKTAKEMAKILGISFRTVEFHVNSIKNKMQCNTKNAVIEKAINSGLINLIPSSIFQKSLSCHHLI